MPVTLASERKLISRKPAESEYAIIGHSEHNVPQIRIP